MSCDVKRQREIHANNTYSRVLELLCQTFLLMKIFDTESAAYFRGRQMSFTRYPETS